MRMSKLQLYELQGWILATNVEWKKSDTKEYDSVDVKLKILYDSVDVKLKNNKTNL